MVFILGALRCRSGHPAPAATIRTNAAVHVPWNGPSRAPPSPGPAVIRLGRVVMQSPSSGTPAHRRCPSHPDANARRPGQVVAVCLCQTVPQEPVGGIRNPSAATCRVSTTTTRTVGIQLSRRSATAAAAAMATATPAMAQPPRLWVTRGTRSTSGRVSAVSRRPRQSSCAAPTTRLKSCWISWATRVRSSLW